MIKHSKKTLLPEDYFKDHVITEKLSYDDLFLFEALETRDLRLVFDIGEDSLEYVSQMIRRFNLLDKGIPVEERKPIKIFINSAGGSVTDGVAIIDEITMSKTPVYTINICAAYSMGGVILASGHKRFCYPNSTALIHAGSTMIMNDSKKAREIMDFFDNYTEQTIKNLFITRTKITKEEYEKKEREEWYLSAEDQLNYGLVDAIWNGDDYV